MKKFALILSFVALISGLQAAACPVPGTYKIGPTGAYPSITSAISDLSGCGTLSGSYIFELQAAYNSSVETFPINIPVLGTSASNTVTFRPELGAVVTITSSSDFGTVKLNGAQYVFFDGRAGGVGSSNQLTIENTSTTFASSTPTTGVSTSATVFNVSNATGFAVGMQLGVGPGSGIFASGTTITNISGNQITISNAPVVALTAASTIVVGYTPAAVTFINDASYNSITYCNVKSASKNANSGTVFFSTGITTGNDNNTISNCEIYDGVSTPLMSIYSYGSYANTTLYNSGNKILNNRIHDFHSAAASPSGILLRASSDWTIDGNSIYQTSSRNYNTVALQYNAISISNNFVGSNFKITNNYIGGTAPNAGGTPLTMSGMAHFVGIGIYSSATLTSSLIQSNVIQNILYSSSGTTAVNFRPIILFDGNVNCLNNLIGSKSVSNSIDLTVSGTGFLGYGIAAGVAGGNGGTMVIKNNTVSGINLSELLSSQPALRGILGTQNITYTIDSNTVSNLASNANNLLRPIGLTTTISGCSISYNTVNNISNTSTGSNVQVFGIYTNTSTSTFNIVGNSISNISSSTTNINYGSISGIYIAVSNGANNLIAQNTISSIRAISTTATYSCLCGIFTSATGGKIIKNKIYDLTNLLPNGYVAGYFCFGGGNWQVSNNMISLTNSPNVNSAGLYGIYDGFANAGSRNYYHNSIYIGGSGAGDNANIDSYDLFYVCAPSGTSTAIKNNIFQMSRTGAGHYYSIANCSSSSSGFTSNNNILNNVNASSIGLWGTSWVTNDKTFANWQTASGGDANSYTGEYIPFTSTATGDLHINTSDATLVGSAYASNIESHSATGTGITDDIDGDTRPGPAGSIRGGGSSPDIGADEVDLVNKGDNFWTGNVSTDWNDPANWTLSIPSVTTNAVIPSGLTNYPVINTVFDIAKNMVIASGVTISVTSTGSLKLAGSLSNDGTFTNNGELAFTGSASQTLAGGGTFSPMSTVTVNKTADTVKFKSSFGIKDTLKLQGGVFNLNNVIISLLSDSTKTARVAPVTGGNFAYTGTGKFYIERYLPMSVSYNSRRWRLLTAPVSNTGNPTIWDSWQEGATPTTTPTDASLGGVYNPYPGYGTIITNQKVAANHYDAGSTNSPSIYYMNSAGVWSVPTATNGTTASSGLINPINGQQGFMVFVRGDRSIVVSSPYINTSGGNKLRAKGQLNVGTVNVGVTGGNQIIGNPYASAVSFNNVSFNGIHPGANVGTGYELWDPKLLGSKNVGAWVTFSSNGDNTYTFVPNYPTGMSSYGNAGFGNLDNNGNIESGEAFFINATSAGSFIFNETDKVTGSTTSGIASRPASPSDNVYHNTFSTLYTNLLSYDASGNPVLADGVASLFGTNFHNSVDLQDAKKLLTFTSKEKIGILRDSVLLSIERRNTASVADTVFYSMTLEAGHNYQLNVNCVNFDSTLIPFVEDNYLKTSVALSNAGQHSYDFSTTVDPLSYSTDRFRLIFKVLNTVPVKINSIHAFRQQKNNIVEWEAGDQVNIKYFEVERSVDGVHFSIAATIGSHTASQYNWTDTDPAKGMDYYRIHIVSTNGESLYSSIVKVNSENELISSITVFPNPVTGRIISLSFSNMLPGKYQYRLMSNTGQTLAKDMIDHRSATTVEAISLSKKPSSGQYMLEITAPDGTLRHIQAIYL